MATRVLELGVTEQNLDDSNIGVLLEQMGSEAVPQRVQRHVLLDPGCLCGGVAGTIELARGHRLHGVAAWKQPARGPCRPPPDAQQFEQARRKHHVTVLAAFALFHADDHPLAVDVGDLERDDLGGAQARAIGDAQGRLVFEPGRSIEQPCHFLRAEHHWQLARLMDERRVCHDVVAPKCDPEEKP